MKGRCGRNRICSLNLGTEHWQQPLLQPKGCNNTFDAVCKPLLLGSTLRFTRCCLAEPLPILLFPESVVQAAMEHHKGTEILYTGSPQHAPPYVQNLHEFCCIQAPSPLFPRLQDFVYCFCFLSSKSGIKLFKCYTLSIYFFRATLWLY